MGGFYHGVFTDEFCFLMGEVPPQNEDDAAGFRIDDMNYSICECLPAVPSV